MFEYVLLMILCHIFFKLLNTNFEMNIGYRNYRRFEKLKFKINTNLKAGLEVIAQV